MKDQEIIQLSDRQHILLRPSMYVGAVDKIRKEEYIVENGKFVKKEISYVPGLIKIINEIIDNSVDEAVRTNYEFGNKIRIDIDDNSVTIEDNGRGIPVKKSPGSDHYMPVLAFCEARAGSNFVDDENRSTIGLNGVGSALTNIYSKLFKVDTADGKNKLSLECKNNMESDEFSIRKNSSKGTRVYFEPDFEKFSVSKLDDVHKSIIEQRLTFLAISHPQIKFYFNKNRINIGNQKNFMSMFSDSYEILSGDNWFVGVFPNDSDDFNFFSYVNGLFIKNGGNHVNLISHEIVSRVRDKLVKKFKTIKPGDIRNKLSLVVFFQDFKNMKFDSQTKETLTNSTSEIRDYMNISTKDWDDFGKKILRNNEILEPIVEIFKIKEEFKKKQELKKLSNGKKKIDSDKYYPPIQEKKYLFVAEGDSATSGIMPVFGRKEIGYFSLKGKPLNTFETKIMRMAANKEIQSIVDILNIDLTNPETDMDYEKVVMATDQDADGIHIRSLLLTFFHRFTPKLLKDERICFINTPLVIAKKKNDIKKWFFDFKSYKEYDGLEKYDWSYMKGLGSFQKSDLQHIVEKSGGLDSLLVSYQTSDSSSEELKTWMKNSESDQRKERLYGKSFNISTV